MMPVKSPEELAEIVAQFVAPELIFDQLVEVGPDEKLYLLHDKNAQKYAIWARDNMSKLEFEARGLEQNQNVTVAKWLPLKEADRFENDEKCKFYSDGDWYALALI